MSKWQLCGLAALSAIPAWAQVEGADGSGDAAASLGYRLEPRLALSETYFNNANLAPVGSKTSDLVTTVSPGVRLLSNQGRLTGYLDAGLNAIYRAQGTAGDSLQQLLNASGRLDAYQGRVIVDMGATSNQQSVSAFGAPAGAVPGGINQTQVSTWRMSPSIRGLLPGDLSYEARYSIQGVHSATSLRPNSEIQGWSAQLGSQSAGRQMGWTLVANQQTATFGQRSNQFDTLRASVSYPFTTQFSGTATLGAEANDLRGPRRSYDNYGVSAVWRPSDRTSFSADVMERYFGTGYGMTLEQRGARTVWRYTARRDAVAAPTATTASLGNLYDLLDNYYRSFEPDPVKRDALVQAQLQRSGLPADYQMSQSFLTSSVTLRETQQLSLMLLGQRDTLTLMLNRGNVSRLQQDLISLPADDLSSAGGIKTQGWGAMYSHRLSPRSNLTASLNSTRSEAANGAPSSSTHTLFLTLGTALAPRTNATLSYRRSLYERGTTSGAQSALTANLTILF